MTELTEATGLGERMVSMTLPNGLVCHFVPKPGYHKTYAMFTTQFGSIDNSFRTSSDADFTTIPAGSAHFLEHKLFDKEDYDAFDLFGKSGASSNAFTSATQTSYLFSGTTAIADNLNILLDFVQDPYFTDATVEKEKGIIGQEIQMYQDDAGWRLYSGILGNLYPTHPVHLDVAGTVESISEITPEVLREIHAAFYHPSNMVLTVVGNFDVEEVAALVTANQAKKDFGPAGMLERGVGPDYDLETILPFRMLTMPISRAKGIVGIKGTEALGDDLEGLRYAVTCRMLLELLFGDSGETYEKLYNAGVIDDSFFTEFTRGRGYNFIALGGDNVDPAVLTESLVDAIANYTSSPDFNADRFARLKKAALGKFYASLNSLESIANQVTDSSFGSTTLFDVPAVMESISFRDVQAVAASILNLDALSVFHIMSEQTEGIADE
ncbi:EF-P 5-aminopentanol modification-associated protein YfmH [Lacticaseibacillus hulanensis]|uniref:EF-P 5-aminopentanol modification-associated protein YfmH n=1 Tax=Lacticaseibacillus hulanensis TaxID=2493111 RepID=UPI000FDBCDB1|nr:pitrilysin family protein [Lacticaseibacillus hulanensis]